MASGAGGRFWGRVILRTITEYLIYRTIATSRSPDRSATGQGESSDDLDEVVGRVAREAAGVSG